VNFIFNQNGNGPVALQGTSGKDVIFANNGGGDTLTGFGGQDQFVFSPTSSNPATALHTVTDFTPGTDTLDVRQFSGINAANVQAIVSAATQQGNDTLVTLDATDQILLKNLVLANLHASDFMVHS